MNKLLCLLLLVPVLATAAPPLGERLYATCSACHGTNGKPVGNALPKLAGQRKEALIASMRAFRDGTRPATIMHQISKGYPDQYVEQMAAWLAMQKP